MRAFKGVNLKTIQDPATRTALQALDYYTRQTGRALARSIEGGQSPEAIPNQTTSRVGGGGGSSGTSFVDDSWRIVDEAIPSKVMRFELSGITTGNTRTLTVPDASGTLALTSELPSLPLAIADGGTGQTTAMAARLALLPTSNFTPGYVLTVNAGSTDVEWAVGGGSRLRSIVFPVGCWTDNTITALGTTPNAAGKIDLLPGVFARTHLLLQLPQDYVSTPVLTVFAAGSANDGSTVDYWVYSKKMALGSQQITGAYDNADYGGGSPTGTNEIYNTNVNITGSFSTGDVVRLTLERDGFADGNLDTQFFLGASFYYIADS